MLLDVFTEIHTFRYFASFAKVASSRGQYAIQGMVDTPISCPSGLE